MKSLKKIMNKVFNLCRAQSFIDFHDCRVYRSLSALLHFCSAKVFVWDSEVSPWSFWQGRLTIDRSPLPPAASLSSSLSPINPFGPQDLSVSSEPIATKHNLPETWRFDLRPEVWANEPHHLAESLSWNTFSGKVLIDFLFYAVLLFFSK